MGHEKRSLPDAGFLIRAAAAWFVCAALSLCLSALLAATTGLGERGLGYLSSVNSFLCAAAAGAAAISRSRISRFLTALLTATALVILLLTIGFLIRDREMDPSSILSVVSFTYAGALLGTVLSIKPGGHRRRQSFRGQN